MPVRGLSISTPSPRAAVRASRTRAAVSASLMVGGVFSSGERTTVGSLSSGTPRARAVLAEMRSMPSSSLARTSGLSARTVSCMSTRSEMMLCLMPPLMAPTVTTAPSSGLVSRLRRDCRPTTMCEATRIGSTPRCGEAPWVATPWTAMSTLSELDEVMPSGTPIRPVGVSAETWKARA
ncbi:hypothetical protein D3C73_1172910 [compost metagenome]